MNKTLFDFAVATTKAQAEINTLCHKADPDTSREAAKKMVESGKLADQEEWVLSHISFYCRSKCTTKFTAKEVANFINNETPKHFYYIVQRRLSGLCNKGKIKRIQIGKRRIGATKLFKPIYKKRDGCCVWRLI